MQKYQSSISINSLYCAVDSKVILSDINFNLVSGQSVTITGPNGIGKTLLLNTIVGFKSIFKGKISINKINLSNDPSNRQEHIGYYGHKASLHTGLTVIETIEYWKAYYSSDANTSELIKFWDLPNKTVESCSEGQRKRLALVRLSLMNRNIWILDEPTTNLDFVGKKKFSELHTSHLRSGGLSIITSHEPAQVKEHKIINLERHSDKN